MNSKPGVRIVLSAATFLLFALSGCSDAESGFAEPNESASRQFGRQADFGFTVYVFCVASQFVD
jgi:hypothetical protein